MSLNNPLLDEIDQAHSGLSAPAKQSLIQGLSGIQIPGVNVDGGGFEGGIEQPAAAAASPAVEPSVPGMIGVRQPDIQPDIQQPPTVPGAIPMSAQSAQGMSVASPAPGLIPIAAKAESPVVATSGLIPVKPTANQAELGRLQSTGSGASQIKSPWARIPAQIGDALLSGFLPGVAANIPGTSIHHNALLGQAEDAVNQDEDVSNNATKRHLEEAQAAEQESLPEFHQAKAELEATKATNKRELDNSKLDLSREVEGRKKSEGELRADAALRQHGFKKDEAGNTVPLPYEEMSEEQQSVHDLKTSQAELADARKAYEDAKTKNAPALMDLAKQRIENASKSSSIAERRLGLSERTYAARYLGTDGQGEALPGAMITDDNRPVGSTFSQNVRPTGSQRNKADMAGSAKEQLADIRDIVSRRQDIFGPAAGRKTDFTVWLGSQDPDAQRFKAARTIAGDHLAGTFGGRSEAALQALDHAIGQFKDNPKAVLAGVDQIEKANDLFLQRGTPRTTGSNASHATGGPAPSKGIPIVTTKDQFDKLKSGAEYMEDGKKYRKP